MVAFNGSIDSDLHAQFLDLVPKIEKHARIYFAWINCPTTRADRIAECVALAWKWHRRLAERGKDISKFTMVFVYLVAKAVKCGRRLTGQEKANDVLSPRAQARHNFKVERLPTSMVTAYDTIYGEVAGQRRMDAFEERLRENMVTPIPDQVQFRVDFPAWLETLTGWERRLIKAMAMNERTKDLADKFEVSPGRISQLRKEFKEGWDRYCEVGEEVVPA